MSLESLTSLSQYHPVVIEGMGGYDPRDPALVASQVSEQLKSHWDRRPVSKPKLIVIQGDPLEERGISAITPRVASELGVSRGLVCLDEDIADYHAPNADRHNVILEVRYSQLAAVLNERHPDITEQLRQAVEKRIDGKNRKRREMDKAPFKDYFRDFALLQEVTKAACYQLCGDITVAQTSNHIHEFSVSSFYIIGLELGLLYQDQMVDYEFLKEFHQ